MHLLVSRQVSIFLLLPYQRSLEDTPFKPLALLNYPMIDEELGRIAADFWSLTWQSGKRTLPYETRLLLSLANAVRAGRMRREKFGEKNAELSVL